ncbi:MAG: hypothetical protein ACKERG_01005 [Candidatus Hodgkinia cicadicola]
MIRLKSWQMWLRPTVRLLSDSMRLFQFLGPEVVINIEGLALMLANSAKMDWLMLLFWSTY